MELENEFIARLAHELRNPLNAILGWATILNRRQDLPETAIQALQAIERNARLQARMISDLLDYAEISSGKMQLVIETIDPYPVVRAALESAGAAARAAEVTLDSRFDQAALRIEADAARLQQVICNLLTHVIEFSSRGDTVRLEAGRSGGSFRLVVSDRRDAATTRSRGLGLGMTIAKQLTELHSGTFRAGAGAGAGGAGNGSGTLTVQIPLSPEGAEAGR